MSEIDWHESLGIEPGAGSLYEFCRELQIVLPDDIYERGNTLVFIERGALEGMSEFLAHDVAREHGGVLLGLPFYDEEDGRCYVIVYAALPALDTEGTPIHLQFTPSAWAYISGMIEEHYDDLVIVGWYHSHPGLGVFMSETDRATQAAFFNHPWSIAVVIDPLSQRAGWFMGESCDPVAPTAVIPYELEARDSYPEIDLDAISEEDQQHYLQRFSMSFFRWLLPVGVFLFSLGMLAWLIWKHRPDTGMV